MKRRYVLAGGLLAVLALVVALVLPVRLRDWPGGVAPNYPAVDFDPRLTDEAKSALPVRDAVMRYFQRTAGYPSNAAAFAGDLPAGSRAFPDGTADGWRYARAEGPAGVGFSLWRRLGWDAGLQYRWDGSVGTWAFQPADGSPEKVVRLRP
jgi:hypothetical protein